MGDSFALEKDDLRDLEKILSIYLSDSTSSKIHKLNSELECIDKNQNNTIEDICYFTALDIDGSGYVTKFKEFLEDEGEVGLASNCEDIIEKYTKESTEEKVEPEVKETTHTPKKPSYSLEKLKEKLERSLRKVVKNEPAKEFDIHDAIELLLAGTEFEGKYTRDIEAIPWSVTSSIPDFIFDEIQTALEVKFCKEKKAIKKISNEMLKDINPYKKEYKNIIFLVYDMGQITDIEQFSDDFNSIENVTVIVVKH